MAKILAISSQVVFGPVGLNAIVPALQAEGHEVLAIPTVLLSNHPGLGPPVGGAIQIEPYLNALENLRAIENLDAVITGYFANAAQVQSAAHLIAKLKPAIVLIDPVLGDHGKLYVSEAVALEIKTKLIPLATIITPNAFELSWLTGLAVLNEDEALIAARSLNCPEVIVTSIPAGPNLTTSRITPTQVTTVINPKRDHVPNGTGDMLSGLYLARQLKTNRQAALEQSLEILLRAITLSGNTKILAVAEALT